MSFTLNMLRNCIKIPASLLIQQEAGLFHMGVQHINLEVYGNIYSYKSYSQARHGETTEHGYPSQTCLDSRDQSSNQSPKPRQLPKLGDATLDPEWPNGVMSLNQQEPGKRTNKM